MSILGMSSEILQIVKENVHEKPSIKTMKSQAPTMNSFTNSTNDLLTKKRSQSNASNYSSSSQVMDYFKEKFGSPTHDVTHVDMLRKNHYRKN